MRHSGGASLKFCKGSSMPETAKGPLMPFPKWLGLARDSTSPDTDKDFQKRLRGILRTQSNKYKEKLRERLAQSRYESAPNNAEHAAPAA